MKHIPNIFLNEDEIKNNIIKDLDNYNHLINVLRLKKGSKLNILDNKGNIYSSIITDIQKHKIIFSINFKEKKDNNRKKLSLIQSILKISTFEEILEKSTQLGIYEIYPIVTDNTIVNLNLFKSKYERFNKIIKNSSEQSKRAFMPVLKEPINMDKFKKYFNKENTFIAFENANIFLKDIIKNYSLQDNNFIMFGPEGGFSEKEINFFVNENYNLFKITDNILRTETAILAAISNFLYEFNL
ncbi:MAG: ribosomal RNA small subunit methyltransferase E [Candidatus Sericytochromatia bacterium]|nr:MAG: ribosomal RNA small subunit methyltransferase E [Candidatus Sericytochromatia bacterium]